MKKHYLIVITIFSLSLPYNSQGVENGDTRESVFIEMGTPNGVIKSGDYEMLSYERGKVELREGKVTSAELLTPEELEAINTKAKILEQERQKKAAEHKQIKHEQGLELRERIISSTVFPELSGSRKVEILKDFGKKHPDIDITDLLLPALDQMDKELADIKQQNKIEQLEQKIDEAKLEALRAKWRESAARAEAQELMRSQFYIQQRTSNFSPYYHMNSSGLSYGYVSPAVQINHSRDYRSGCWPTSEIRFNNQPQSRKTYILKDFRSHL